MSHRSPKVTSAAFTSRWNERAIALLGTMSDERVASRLGITDTAVQQKRVSLGIPAFGRSRERTKRVWTQQEVQWLGVESDSEISRRIGIDPSVVAAKRRELNIPLANGRTERRRAWSKRELAKLGKISDVEFSRTFHVSRRAIKEKRIELHIKAFAPTTGPQVGQTAGKETRFRTGAVDRSFQRTRASTTGRFAYSCSRSAIDQAIDMDQRHAQGSETDDRS